ncbi:hypothetical protein AB0M39_27900, partial [Streptomyces sp. NPDC051907]|uniref:hypothetical protein n=1 Tax=Streptomyces sp. NPDC051907 TaxID=3155284 RepID=UPI00342CDB90
MSAVPGALVVDGEPITPAALRTAVDRTVRAVQRALGSPGPAVGVDATTGPAVIVAALAAERLDAPLFLRGHCAAVQEWPPQVGAVVAPSGGDLAPRVAAA